MNVGDRVRDKRTGRVGTVAWMSGSLILGGAGDTLVKVTDAKGEWTAYVRQLTDATPAGA